MYDYGCTSIVMLNQLNQSNSAWVSAAALGPVLAPWVVLSCSVPIALSALQPLPCSLSNFSSPRGHETVCSTQDLSPVSTGLARWSQRGVEQQPNVDAGCMELVLHLCCVGIVLALVGVALASC